MNAGKAYSTFWAPVVNLASEVRRTRHLATSLDQQTPTPDLHLTSRRACPLALLTLQPRWGRNLETAGEDPFMAGQYAAQFVRGMQQAPEDQGALPSKGASNCAIEALL